MRFALDGNRGRHLDQALNFGLEGGLEPFGVLDAACTPLNGRHEVHGGRSPDIGHDQERFEVFEHLVVYLPSAGEQVLNIRVENSSGSWSVPA